MPRKRCRITSLSILVFSSLFVFVILASSSPLSAQDTPIKIDTELISFEVTATNPKGEAIRGLSAADFSLVVNGRERKIDFISPIEKNDKNRPLSIVFAIDVSGSITRNELDNLQRALADFVDRLEAFNSQYAVLSFGMKTRKIQSFTRDRKKLRRAFIEVAREEGGLSTHAYDAIDYAVKLLERDSPKTIMEQIPKRVVVVITDGYPVGDTVTPKLLIEHANRANASVFGLILPSYSRHSINDKPVMTLLEASRIIQQTGGQAYYAIGNNFESLMDSLADEITSSYAIAFYPDENLDIASRKFEVEITGKKGIKVKQNRAIINLPDSN